MDVARSIGAIAGAGISTDGAAGERARATAGPGARATTIRSAGRQAGTTADGCAARRRASRHRQTACCRRRARANRIGHGATVPDTVDERQLAMRACGRLRRTRAARLLHAREISARYGGRASLVSGNSASAFRGTRDSRQRERGVPHIQPPDSGCRRRVASGSEEHVRRLAARAARVGAIAVPPCCAQTRPGQIQEIAAHEGTRSLWGLHSTNGWFRGEKATDTPARGPGDYEPFTILATPDTTTAPRPRCGAGERTRRGRRD